MKASTFADSEDLAKYASARKHGASVADALRVGDNGIGKWGDFTAQTARPMAALPPSQIPGFPARPARAILVSYGGECVRCVVADVMPEHSSNGASIDLNPAAARALGITPPALLDGVSWCWE